MTIIDSVIKGFRP